MKFGDSLPQRSVAEWIPFNLDYNEICDLIKKYTVGRIPVANPNVKSDFDDELFEVLIEQFGRIDMFVKSKAGEIDRRITQSYRTVKALCERETGTNPVSSKRLSRYSKAEADLEKIGYDIQCLVRFSRLQYTGFKKLLKKYKKWTGSSCLCDRFLPILDSPDSFHNRDFERHVLILSELLASIRKKFNEAISSKANAHSVEAQLTPNVPPVTTNSLAIIQDDALRTRADLDMALGANSPSNPSFKSGKGGKAVYWVHSDHVVEVQVLLLKHLNIQPTTPRSTVPSTPALSRRPSATGLLSISLNQDKQEDVGTVVLDNLPKFAHAHSTKTIDQAAKAGSAAKIRWCGSNEFAEASIVAGIHTDDPDENLTANTDECCIVRAKRASLEAILDVEQPVNDEGQSNIDRLRGWLKEHTDIVPLVKILARRTRFASGLKVWAVLDRDIRMYKIGEDWKRAISDPNSDDIDHFSTFPHSVLEVRWEGIHEPLLVQELNRTHIIEKVPGFSLDVHAVALLHQPKEMTSPFWFPALSKDIRKTPDASLSVNARNADTAYPNASSSGPSNTSTVAVEQTDATHDSSMTLFTKGVNSYGEHMKSQKSLTWANQTKLSHDLDNAWLGGERYWSEFNNEDDEDEPYTIIIQPPCDSQEDHESGFFGRISKYLQKLFGYDDFEDEILDPRERTTLLARSISDTSDDDLESGMTTRRNSSTRYNTLEMAVEERHRQERHHERMLLRGYIFCFALSVSILVGAAAWVLTRNPNRRGPHSEAGTGVGETVAVFFAAISAAYGFTLFIARKDRLSLIHKATVIGIFIVICLSGSLILSLAYNNWLRP